ncbi:MAG: alkaline phosphatase family protein [Terriglobales bacterium]
MARLAPLLTLILLGASAGLLLNLNARAGVANNLALYSSLRIRHVVVIVQENRTPDNLFHDTALMKRGADIASVGMTSNGPILLAQGNLATNFDLNHTHEAWEKTYNGGKMDGAGQIFVQCNAGTTHCPPPNPEYMYVSPSEVQPYFQLAEQYTFGDRMFQTNQGPSFPAHQFILSGTSAPTATSDLFAAENLSVGSSNAGCIATPGVTVALIDPLGNESQSSYPCYEHPTLTDLLDGRGISWRYYAPSAGSIWTAPDAIRHMCQPQKQSTGLVCTGSTWQKVIIPQTQVLTDIANGQLAQVSWVIPDGHASDHAGQNDGSGPSWVASIVNAIGNSQYWNDTAIFITWDDWGGWYDHVAPKIINSYEYGFRVPLVVVSPYAKAAYISHVTHHFGSILKFIEETYRLPSLGYADARADDLSDCFDFFQPARDFKTIPAPVSAADFLNDPRPPTDPDND